MEIAVKNEALTRYESELKKHKQKLSAIENGLRTIRKSLRYSLLQVIKRYNK